MLCQFHFEILYKQLYLLISSWSYFGWPNKCGHFSHVYGDIYFDFHFKWMKWRLRRKRRIKRNWLNLQLTEMYSMAICRKWIFVKYKFVFVQVECGTQIGLYNLFTRATKYFAFMRLPNFMWKWKKWKQFLRLHKIWLRFNAMSCVIYSKQYLHEWPFPFTFMLFDEKSNSKYCCCYLLHSIQVFRNGGAFLLEKMLDVRIVKGDTKFFSTCLKQKLCHFFCTCKNPDFGTKIWKKRYQFTMEAHLQLPR